MDTFNRPGLPSQNLFRFNFTQLKLPFQILNLELRKYSPAPKRPLITSNPAEFVEGLKIGYGSNMAN
jgi:hypothetical protein